MKLATQVSQTMKVKVQMHSRSFLHDNFGNLSPCSMNALTFEILFGSRDNLKKLSTLLCENLTQTYIFEVLNKLPGQFYSNFPERTMNLVMAN